MEPAPTSSTAEAEPLRLDQVIRGAELIREELPGASVFGHMRVATAGRTRDIYLGSVNHITATLTLVDWQQSPLAEVFLCGDPGFDYEVAVGEGSVEGRLVGRHVFSWRGAQLARVEGTAGSFERVSGGWVPVPPLMLPPLDAGPPVPGGRVTRLEVELDPAQRQIVERPPSEPLLILGEAGFGKTTVALHRLLHLIRSSRAPLRCAVIVPTESLRRLLETMLKRSLEDGATAMPEVWTFDGWVARAAHRAFPGLPRRESTDIRSGVITLKRHRALLDLLPAVARRTQRRVSRSDLHHLFGDQLLLERISEETNRAVTLNMVNEVLEHTRIQFSDTTEAAFSHVDADRLSALDGRPLDEGTSMSDASTIDVEDYAVLFELDRLRSLMTGEPPAPVPRFDAVVLDEAQELAPIELSLIGRALRPRGSLVVAGDASQQVDASAGFESWPSSMQSLGQPAYITDVLAVGYRCPPEVTALAQTLRDSALTAAVPRPAQESHPLPTQRLVFTRFYSQCHLVQGLVDSLRALVDRDPTARVALIARSRPVAVRLGQSLEKGLPIRVQVNGDVDMSPGIAVTCVQEVKGLEFDVVVIPDASEATYPSTTESRRALYVAITRANQQLVVATPGPWTSLLGAPI